MSNKKDNNPLSQSDLKFWFPVIGLVVASLTAFVTVRTEVVALTQDVVQLEKTTYELQQDLFKELQEIKVNAAETRKDVEFIRASLIEIRNNQ